MCVRFYVSAGLHMHVCGRTVCVKGSVCDKCIGGTVGCVLKISRSQQPVPTLQRDYTALQTVKKERKKERKKQTKCYLSDKAVWFRSAG